MSETLKYETLMLARTEVTNDELSMIEKRFDQLMNDCKGKLLSFDRWGKYRLAYDVRKNGYGIYVLARYEVPKDQVENIFKELFVFFDIKCNEIISRYVNVKLNGEISFSYPRPEPIDGGREHANLDSFLKKNKLEGLLGEVNSSSDKNKENNVVGKADDRKKNQKETSFEQEDEPRNTDTTPENKSGKLENKEEK